MSKSFESSRAPEPVGAFPHAKRAGNLLFLSGIGPRVRGSKEIPGVTLDSAGNIVSYDIEKQCRAVFENVRLVRRCHRVPDGHEKGFPDLQQTLRRIFCRRGQTKSNAYDNRSRRVANADYYRAQSHCGDRLRDVSISGSVNQRSLD